MKVFSFPSIHTKKQFDCSSWTKYAKKRFNRQKSSEKICKNTDRRQTITYQTVNKPLSLLGFNSPVIYWKGSLHPISMKLRSEISLDYIYGDVSLNQLTKRAEFLLRWAEWMRFFRQTKLAKNFEGNINASTEKLIQASNIGQKSQPIWKQHRN